MNRTCRDNPVGSVLHSIEVCSRMQRSVGVRMHNICVSTILYTRHLELLLLYIINDDGFVCRYDWNTPIFFYIVNIRLV